MPNPIGNEGCLIALFVHGSFKCWFSSVIKPCNFSRKKVAAYFAAQRQLQPLPGKKAERNLRRTSHDDDDDVIQAKSVNYNSSLKTLQKLWA